MTPATRPVAILIIGAGPTGLGAAVRAQQRGLSYLLIEQAAHPGGMAASARDRHGFTWDLGGHVLHSHFPAFDKAIAAAGVEMLTPHRDGRVWSGGELLPAPIQQQLATLPHDLRPDAPVRTLADYYRNHYGAELLARFFRPFTEKMWATRIDSLDHAWTAHRSGSTAPNVPRPALATTIPTDHAPFPYPAGGTGALWSGIAALLEPSQIRYRTRLQALNLPRREALLQDSTTITYTHCISTIPLPTLAASISDTCAAAAAANLTASSAVLVGLGYAGEVPPQLAGVSWIYAPDPDITWHRATMLSHYDPANAGPSRWSVLCETGTSDTRNVSVATAVRSARAALTRLGAHDTNLVSLWTKTIEHGYPLPTLGRDAILHTLDQQLITAGVRSRGRFGGWRYESSNSDYSFMQGMEAVDAFLDNTPEDVYWHPERF